LSISCRHYLVDIIHELCEKSPGEVSGIFAGLAGAVGFGSSFTDFLRGKTSISALRVGSDAVPMLTGGLYRADGGCVIAGTGTACFVRRGGELYQVGGWGYMFDSGGSGYNLGRDAIAAVLHEHDGQGPETALTKLVSSRLGGHPKDMIARLYEGGTSYVASFAATVFEGCRLGDRVSLEIMNRNVGCIAKMICAAGKRLDGTFTVVLGGGMFRNYPEYSAALCGLVPDRIGLLVSDTPPVFGAAVEAVYTAGDEISDDFKDNFIKTYGKY
jgi:N-acetylglucosamine kinase-like BadF-type ATPase